MASRVISDLHPKMQPLCHRFLDACAHAGYRVGLSCTYRSNEEQEVDYAKGRTTPGNIITNARAGQSAHNVTIEGNPASCAFDFYIYAPDGKHLDWDANDKAWKDVIAIGQQIGLVSGSTWKSLRDNPHMELKEWKIYQQHKE